MSKETWSNQIICPRCDHKHSDSCEYFGDSSDETTEIQCASCEIDLIVSRTVTVTYTTQVMEKGK